ncbi:isochorismatase hydrolase-like protein [Calycina marina]|uniref:Isochorismatase hydrolase-like protein n=1 Tax=Calycina marina TaxID=1763456 RepID=A0A9P7YY29_9HELO|nr:isochorismatase hydrolase-like protein [Calycina marina]
MAKAFRTMLRVSPSTASTSALLLLVIDAQNEYANGHLKTENVALNTQSHRFSARDIPRRQRLSSIMRIVHKTPAGAPLTPKGGEKIIEKHYPGSFTGTDFNDFAKKSGKSELVLTGSMAHVCKEYNVLLAGDAIGDRNLPGVQAEDLVRATLAELDDAFGTVIESKSVS